MDSVVTTRIYDEDGNKRRLMRLYGWHWFNLLYSQEKKNFRSILYQLLYSVNLNITVVTTLSTEDDEVVFARKKI